MFSRPIMCARMSASGLLVKVETQQPTGECSVNVKTPNLYVRMYVSRFLCLVFQDGQTATVEVHSISSLLQDSRKNHELSVFPGPLKPGETHKNSKISSVAGRRDITDKESYVLLWKILVLQQGQLEDRNLGPGPGTSSVWTQPVSLSSLTSAVARPGR